MTVSIPSESAVTRTEEAAGASAVQFLLDGLGVASLQELKAIVDVGAGFSTLCSHVEARGGVEFWRDDHGWWYVDVAYLRGEGDTPGEAVADALALLVASTKGLSDDDSR